MAKSITVNRKSRGRPVTTGTGTLVGVRLLPDQLKRLDDWIEEDGARFSRPEAIRRLLETAWGRTVASRGLKPIPSLLEERAKPRKK